ncbi:MAG: polysaccharide biosynthesis tyrosine autokinase [Bdellovibrio sp.]|nr:polysaccharide biosynthesis tyrosine autokinase [Methylotenera sp.]
MKNNIVTQLNPPVSMLPNFDKNLESNTIFKAKPGFGSTLISLTQPNSLQSESLRSLRSQLLLRWFNLGNKSLAIVGANLGEGCSYVSANLAIAFAQLGMRTLLIDANLRDPNLHRLFNLKNDIGLSNILSGHTGQVVIDPLDSIDNLSILGAGAISTHSQQLLSRASFTELIKQTTAQYDVVLVDTAPAMLSADAQAAAAACSGVVLVSRLNQTKLADLKEMRNQLAITNAKIVGSVINDF